MQYPNITPVAFSLFNKIEIRWYSLAYIATFILGRMIMRKYVRYYSNVVNILHLDSLMNYIIVGMIIGARLGYCIIYDFKFYINNPVDILYIWQGGLSFHGGALGVTAGIYLFTRRYNLSFISLLDMIVTLVPIGSFFGRIGNFINSELYGRATNLAIGIVFPADLMQIARHPSQIYEALLEGLLLFCLMQYLFWKRKLILRNGYLSSIFGIGYSIARFIGEIFREPDIQIGFIANKFTMGQVISIGMFLFSVSFLVYNIKKNANS